MTEEAAENSLPEGLAFRSHEGPLPEGQAFRRCENSCFVSGHDLSRAVTVISDEGFSPWGIPFLFGGDLYK
jgi:hypothetical protein